MPTLGTNSCTYTNYVCAPFLGVGFMHSSEANNKLLSVLLDTYGKEYAIVRVETRR